MELNKILSADFLDILFEGRNKQYGAYDLRRTYVKRMVTALLVTLGLCLAIFLGSLAFKAFGKKVAVLDVKSEVEIASVKNEAPPPPPPPPPPAPPPPKVETVKFTPPKIVEDEKVKEKIQEVKEDVKIAEVTKAGVKEDIIVQKPVEAPAAVVEKPKQEDENKIFNKVEVEASYEGDWRNYLQKNLNAQVAADNGAPEGSYSVVVKFVVMKDGSLNDITCETDPGYGVCDEAKRVIKKARWKPALQNGRNVNAYRRQPITVVVAEQ